MDPKTAETLGHLRETLEEGRTYEYGERIVTTSKRLAMRNKQADAMFLLLEGTRDLLLRGDFESVLCLILQVLELAAASPKDANSLTAYFADAYTKMPPNLREKFISKALKLCNTPQLYRAVAEALEREDNFVGATSHWMRAEDVGRLASCLERVMSLGYKSERDLFIARAGLHLICLGQSAAAVDLLSRLGTPPTPILNFVRFLIQAIEAKNPRILAYLKEKYDPSLRRDPNFRGYIAHIEKKYFGIEPPREGGLSALLNLFS